METINFLLGAILQVVLVLLISLICWTITARKRCSFFEWIGLKKVKTNNKKGLIILSITTVIVLLIPGIFIIPNFVSPSEMATNQFSGKGLSTLVQAVIYSFVQTGLSEEILFRGFIGKRLINRVGFNIGNLLQGIIFGLLHGVMVYSIVSLYVCFFVVLFTGTAGYMMGYVDEKLTTGSIVPGWLMHGCSNLLMSLVAMFNLI